MENAVTIANMNQLGHLDRLFDVAEEIVTRDVNKIILLGGYDSGEVDSYVVRHPETVNAVYRVVPRLFNAFVEARYVDLGNESPVIADKEMSLRQYVEYCRQATLGRLELDRQEVYGEWIVKKAGGLFRAVRLGSGLRRDSEGLVDIDWIMMNRDQKRGRQNG